MNIDHLKDKFDLNELEVSLLEYIKKNQKQLKNIRFGKWPALISHLLAIYRFAINLVLVATVI
ncbi:MAG: hypothetical protein ACLR43_10440 [Faecalibacillus faecis]